MKYLYLICYVMIKAKTPHWGIEVGMVMILPAFELLSSIGLQYSFEIKDKFQRKNWV